MLDAKKIKQDFPIFGNNPNLIYLDSGVTSLKPQVVIDKLVEYYTSYSANIKRGIYKISERATQEYENTRAVVASFIHSKKDEVIFTKSTTESLNLVAYSLGRKIVDAGDEIVVTIMDHHSNFVPWQVLAGESGAVFKVIDIDNEGYLTMYETHIQNSESRIHNGNSKFKINVEDIITKKTKILALPLVSNVLGTINPVKEIAYAAKKINPNIVIIVDAAQAAGHNEINVKDLGVDFIAFSSHKMFGPTGVGVLWGKEKLLDDMYPFLYGGEMIESVSIEKTTFAPIPEKFEAGTPPIAEVIAYSAAIEYIKKIGFMSIRQHEQELISYTLKRLKEDFDENILIFGPKDITKRGGVVSFALGDIHPHDIAQVLDEEGIAIRAGHHCTMPLHTRLGLAATTRISLSIYNDKEDIEKLIEVLHKAEKVLRK